MDPQKVLEELVKKAERDKDILAVMLFGSYARGEPARDIDVCLVLYPKKISK
ncbi:MAG: nucleotidyltransferase domain-containing protein, partial [Candidatus Lokiarchaeia archaeon]